MNSRLLNVNMARTSSKVRYLVHYQTKQEQSPDPYFLFFKNVILFKYQQ